MKIRWKLMDKNGYQIFTGIGGKSATIVCEKLDRIQ